MYPQPDTGGNVGFGLPLHRGGAAGGPLQAIPQTLGRRPHSRPRGAFFQV
jgi:hypothetical protein